MDGMPKQELAPDQIYALSNREMNLSISNSLSPNSRERCLLSSSDPLALALELAVEGSISGSGDFFVPELAHAGRSTNHDNVLSLPSSSSDHRGTLQCAPQYSDMIRMHMADQALSTTFSFSFISFFFFLKFHVQF